MMKKMKTMKKVSSARGAGITLNDRGTSYGDFEDGANIAQALKFAMRNTLKHGWDTLPPDMKESLDMIQSKISRIINGDENHIDSWHDIQGYALLIENRIKLDQSVRKID